MDKSGGAAHQSETSTSGETHVERHKTAMARATMSRPVRLALEHGIISGATTVFDYGCGQGGDVALLGELAIACSGWDPEFAPGTVKTPAEVVNLGYVVNVIEDPAEREATLSSAWSLTRKALVVAARLVAERESIKAERFGDGWLTSRGTFQKFYTHSELKTWIDTTLDVNSIPLGPGIYVAFRTEAQRQEFLADRLRRPLALPRRTPTSQTRSRNVDHLLTPLCAFLEQQGRLPRTDELRDAQDFFEHFKSIPRAIPHLRKILPSESWENIEGRLKSDLLVYLALQRFTGRAKLNEMPENMQLSVKLFFGSLSAATAAADSLLFSVGKIAAMNEILARAPFGKLTQEALYVHRDYLHMLPAEIRVYEGCAKAFVGGIEDANIVKLNRIKPQVSYLSYPTFETDAHPALAFSLVTRLGKQEFEFKNFRDSPNPPILHRKEEFVPAEHSSRTMFAALTKEEERLGLFTNTRTIGTRAGWEQCLAAAGVVIRGHCALSSE